VLLIRRAADALAVAGSDAEGMVAIASAVVPSRPQAQASVSMRIVLDCSGSMAGERLDWASVACQRLVAGLAAGDEFSITRFGSTHQHLRPRLTPADEPNKRAALDWLSDVAADLGGTEMQAALKAAAALPGVASRSDAVLITDGEIWATDALVRWARGAGLRIHVIGVGATPNAAFLRELARETGGRSEFVTPGEDLVGAVDRVLAAAGGEDAQPAHLVRIEPGDDERRRAVQQPAALDGRGGQRVDGGDGGVDLGLGLFGVQRVEVLQFVPDHVLELIAHRV